ncbi:protein shisa-7-like isoform X1 [Anguilla anguilla]|uniref:protein shisa-7-like isoform X1 n=1 Tax=Anguilla anguilla TaxID=7936 RepID=UPI0015ADA779|nr:protein shisa-7-like isoform X1 [Anguilla anguilla]XP_035287168.1 protein shisa-7-like isoform X1 [Anguilla anguilla]XP_035287169.1 protein shisa-7-like isoform X1 [Anguilla anguilla]XP_035287170.1 protein shisa-7-like isoform X1 [Anguilla anguilla]XP_035287171.1 protein shisa-7-like isoform X1 [Anguilla anguilla]XP_035287172.1 protein shisa-7-like isoform X1 [Anguilla anguilla]
MKPAIFHRALSLFLVPFLMFPSCSAALAISAEHRLANGSLGSISLHILTGQGSKQTPPTLPRPKKAIKRAETLPKPLSQIMLPRNVTSNALKPPLGAAQVEPAPKHIVDVDVCRGYYDVMGHYDLTFNCTKGTFIYCCGTCHYRFCCQHRSNRLDQDSCNNYDSPHWANTQPPGTLPTGHASHPDFDPLKGHRSNTAFVIGGVISFTIMVAVGMKVAFHKFSRRPRDAEDRALVDILRHQSSPVQPEERNNSTAVTTGGTEGTTDQHPKNLYAPVGQSKDNRKRMNNAQLASSGTLLSTKHKMVGPQPSFYHSFHNLAQLPPSYEAATNSDISRYSSLKRLEKAHLGDYSGYCTSKRKPKNAPPSYILTQHHLQWGGDYTLTKGTLPLHGSRPHLNMSSASALPPNLYPLKAPYPQHNPKYDTLSKPPRRVKSQDQLLTLGDGNTLSRLSKNQQQQYYKAIAAAKKSNNQNLRKSQERLVMSPDQLEERAGGGAGVGDYRGLVQTLPRLPPHKKSQSQQNVCATSTLDRHHMIKMNSHPTSGKEQERKMAVPSQGGGAPSWMDSPGGGTGTLTAPNAKRLAFATKRQNNIEQLNFIPGVGGAGGGGRKDGGSGGRKDGGSGGRSAAGGGTQTLRTARKNEVTV